MKEISATDAARRFSAMLDAVEHDGETFVVTRGGRGVARIEPAAGASGAAVKALLLKHRADPSWIDEPRELRAVGPAQDRAWQIIAATAKATGRIVLSADAGAFADLPGVVTH